LSSNGINDLRQHSWNFGLGRDRKWSKAPQTDTEFSKIRIKTFCEWRADSADRTLRKWSGITENKIDVNPIDSDA
jgi:hypothetical protein